jgi:RimJ/RimL family protein N-acetyltransferase
MNDEKTAWPRHIRLKNGLLLTLRPAVPQDAEQVLAYVEQVAGESENLTFGPGEFDISLDQERLVLQEAAQAPTSLYLLAEMDSEILGMLTFSAEKRPRMQHSGEFGMSVLSKYWNLGIGEGMLVSLIAWARQTPSIRKINLRVRVDNLAAMHLYGKYGFAPEGRRTREFYLHEQFTDVFVMGLPLDPM